ncbi:hypothetical protein SAMN05444352_1132 [Pseudomonas japonica]|uniref:Uncharacterized protein n=1 Tax=Pseudomonas japonica TaxID=256466 RepID=A0A239GL53_9PSED|nr:hypothetical protein SAMN05444352_1132 [Pseudomonas japonica]
MRGFENGFDVAAGYCAPAGIGFEQFSSKAWLTATSYDRNELSVARILDAFWIEHTLCRELLHDGGWNAVN